MGYDLSSLDIEEEPNIFNSQSYSANSNSSFELDLLGEGASALMVDPSSVVPFVSSHRRFNNQTKVENTQEEDTSKEDKPKSESSLVRMLFMHPLVNSTHINTFIDLKHHLQIFIKQFEILVSYAPLHKCQKV